MLHVGAPLGGGGDGVAIFPTTGCEVTDRVERPGAPAVTSTEPSNGRWSTDGELDDLLAWHRPIPTSPPASSPEKGP